ncbi:MAG: NAD(P)H-hydrate dehydratase [Ferruginibacter sp.]
MKIFSSAQIKAWDEASIIEQGITSGMLMERAAATCFSWMLDHDLIKQPMHIICGKGNNGGDGLALARMLLQNNGIVSIYILESGKPGTKDFQLNLEHLHKITTNIHFIQSSRSFPIVEKDDIIIDALFGTGLNKPLEGIASELAEYINKLGNPVIAIDIPSGLFCDSATRDHKVITATVTLTFQNLKLAFLLPQNEKFTGIIHTLNIGLSNKFQEAEPAVHEITETSLIKNMIRPRNKFSHKGTFGHAAIIAGSYGMMGAAVLAARACLCCGAGKLTCFIPAKGFNIMQTSIPEAMCREVGEKLNDALETNEQFDVISIGPGIGTKIETIQLIEKLFSRNMPMVLDADALNCLAINKTQIDQIPKGSVLTPHPKEFERLFGTADNDFNRLAVGIRQAKALGIYIVLKGHHTAIITPGGKVYFNCTGNAGMAKAGMGDVLTGMITGLICQGYPLPEAAILGVYLHGLAGDIASERFSQNAMQASDLVSCIGEAWLDLTNKKSTQ